MASIITLDLIKSSLRLINAIGIGETPTAAETQDSLRALNDFLETWSIENLTVFTQQSNTFSFVPGQASYTIGPGGNWNMIRPVQVMSGYTRVNGSDFPIVEVTDDWYNLITVKNQQGQIPAWFRYNATAPLGVITIWPIPSVASTITLTSNLMFAPIANTATVLSYPPGYSRALRYGLAVELAGEYGLPVPQVVLEIARSSKAAIKRANIQPVVSRADPALLDVNCYTIGQFLGGNF